MSDLSQFVEGYVPETAGSIKQPRERKPRGRPRLNLTPEERLQRNNEAKRRWLDKGDNRHRHNELSKLYKQREDIKARRKELYKKNKDK